MSEIVSVSSKLRQLADLIESDDVLYASLDLVDIKSVVSNRVRQRHPNSGEKLNNYCYSVRFKTGCDAHLNAFRK